jgi:hypothetical protein
MVHWTYVRTTRNNKTQFVGVLNGIEEKSRIRIRNPSVRIRGSESAPNVTDPEQCNTVPVLDDGGYRVFFKEKLGEITLTSNPITIFPN